MSDAQHRTFKCAACKRDFVIGWTEAEAAEEYRRNFPNEAVAGAAVESVCDDCYRQITAALERGTRPT